MINFCPIGRAAGAEEREAFVEFDRKFKWRESMVQSLRTKSRTGELPPGVEFKLGGETSIDIFPTGWDKTFALRHFPDHDAWFVGDKCEGSGNDREIYEALVSKGRAFMTQGPDDTVKIVKQQMLPNLAMRVWS